jgi:uroporphyrin-III C-methyltransferase
MMRRGTVYLTGAGPGAADLLTVRAASILARAEAVFHDALVSDEVLRLCPAGCAIVAVGKRCGLPAVDRQQTIHRLLDEASRRHAVVVRLKGGDPGIFGRGGEELAFLVERGIPWEIIPGVSAGVGGLSALGLPLTHRDLASSVALFTGSQAIRGDFGGMIRPFATDGSQTLVFYMGARHVAAIADDLLRQGMDPTTYALCASRISAPSQRLLAAPLVQIGAASETAAQDTPALLVVGNVVAFWTRLRDEVPERYHP